MPKPARNFRPLTSEGVRFNTPQYARKWQKLDNTIFEGGRLHIRPGVRHIGPVNKSAEEVGIPTALIEIPTNVETLNSQRLVPNGTVLNQWDLVGDATAHEVLDDNPPDNDTTYAKTDVDGEVIRLNFENLTGTWDAVEGITIGGRARNDGQNGIASVLGLYYFDGSADHLLGEVEITACTTQESDAWQDFIIASAKHPVLDRPWNSTDIDALRITVKRESASHETARVLLPDGNGDHTAWTGVFSDINDNRYIADAKTGELTDSHVSTSTANAKESVTIENPPSGFTSVDTVTAVFTLSVEKDAGDAYVRFFYRGTDNVDYNIGSLTKISKILLQAGEEFIDNFFHGYNFSTVVLATNPQTGVAWTVSDLNDLEFGVQLITSSGEVRWHNLSITVNGKANGGETHLTSLYVDAWGLNGGGGEILSRLVVSNTGLERATSLDDTDFESVGSGITWHGLPAQKSDWAILNGQVYAVNGVNQIIFYPDGTDTWDQFSAKPFGSTIVSVGGRIMLGDVTESSTRNKERLRWSDINDTDDFSAALAGNRDVHDTPGAWLKLKHLLGSIVGYKSKGIYEILITPEVIEPFRHFVRDTETGLVAPATVWPAITAAGQAVHLFLGEGPNGLNVYQYDGNAAVPVGMDIADELRRLVNKETMKYSFAVTDPATRHYLLFVPETDETFFPNQCWAYDLLTATWRKWTFGRQFSCADVWTISALDTDINNHYAGERRAVLGGTDGLVYTFDKTKANDDIQGGLQPYNVQNGPFQLQDSVDDSPPLSAAINVRIETGDMFIPEPPSNIAAARVHIWYRDRGPTSFSLEYSVDGGTTYTSIGSYTMGQTNSGKLHHFDTGFDVRSASRISIAIVRNTDDGRYLGELDIEDITVELDPGGQGV